MNKSLRILCLGNVDNLGIRIFEWLSGLGLEVDLCRILLEEGAERSDPLLYNKQINKYRDRIFSYDKPVIHYRAMRYIKNEFACRIEREYDCILICGGIHSLIMTSKIDIPKIFFPVGYEICYWLDGRALDSPLFRKVAFFRAYLRNKFYTRQVEKCLTEINAITDSYPYNINVMAKKGLGEKVHYLGFGEDCKKNRELIDKDLLMRLNDQCNHADKVFLWFSRLNFSKPGGLDYKGCEIFAESLGNCADQIRSGNIKVFIGSHGNDVKAFEDILRSHGLYDYINWVGHLTYSELLTYLSIDKAFLFTEFGENNSCISGIGRDGYTIGIPMVNSTTDEVMIKQYNQPGVRYYASDSHDLSRIMRTIFAMSEAEYRKIKLKTLQYGNKFIDKSVYAKRLNDIIANVCDA